MIRPYLLLLPIALVIHPVTAEAQNRVRELTDAEIEAIVSKQERKAIAELRAKQKAERADWINYWKGRTTIDKEKVERAAAKKPDPCDDVQNFFVRRNRLDTFQYRKDSAFATGVRGRKDSDGGLFSFAKDQVSDTETVTINTRISLILAQRDPTSRCEKIGGTPEWTPDQGYPTEIEPGPSWRIAAWIDAQGSSNQPRRRNEQSSLQSGLDLQHQVLTSGLFDSHYLTFTPYALSDFRGAASGFGLRGGWEPIAMRSLRLGGRGRAPDPYFDWFWNFRFEVDHREVNEIGVTNLRPGTYNWVGANLNYKFFLFPTLKANQEGVPVPFPDLADRFYGTLSFQYYWDSSSDITVRKSGVELGYNLTQDGFTALSFQYTTGNDKDNLVRTQKYTAGLVIKY